MKILAVIPARGGSKRIPQKNIKEFCGKPIITYSIDAALKSKLFDEVMVSTDNEEITNFAINYGVSVPFQRSSKTSDDYATTVDVLIEVLQEYYKVGKAFDLLCCIYSTAPFVTSEKLKESFKLLESKNADSVISVVKFGYPVQRALKLNGDILSFVWPENEMRRSQDLEIIYHDAGQFYWIKTQVLLNNKSLYGNNVVPYIVMENEVQDIDTEEDWQLAELKFILKNK